MKRFTNPQRQATSSLSIKGGRRSTVNHSMQAQLSLFQSAFKGPNQRTAHGVKKSIPFLNLWAPSASVQKYQAAQAQDRKMSSATSFYDFKPLDSELLLSSTSHLDNLPTLPSHKVYSTSLASNQLRYRERPACPPLNLCWKSSPYRQHRLKMRLHTAVRLPRSSVQEALRLAPRPIRHPRLPV